MSDKQMREAFERWFSSNDCDPLAICRNDDGSYVLTAAEISWASWQAALSQPAPRGVVEVMEIARRLTFADTESVLSAETEGWWGKHDKACAIARELEQAITAIITERDTLRARVAELEKDVERYQFWRNRWGDGQFLSTLAGTIRQLSAPLIRGDYNNLDIVSDAAIAASKEAP